MLLLLTADVCYCCCCVLLPFDTGVSLRCSRLLLPLYCRWNSAATQMQLSHATFTCNLAATQLASNVAMPLSAATLRQLAAF